MKIEITNFAKRHFKSSFGATKILDHSIEEFVHRINLCTNPEYPLLDGYADFCKIMIIPNFTDAKTGSLPITIENYQFLRSGYSARTDRELGVLSRWFEIPTMFISKANYLAIVLYSREQLEKEYLSQNIDEFFELKDDTDYGIVSIMGQMNMDQIDPIPPITMMRNALGTEHGGSGVPINIEDYKKSVLFWNENATVK